MGITMEPESYQGVLESYSEAIHQSGVKSYVREVTCEGQLGVTVQFIGSVTGDRID